MPLSVKEASVCLRLNKLLAFDLISLALKYKIKFESKYQKLKEQSRNIIAQKIFKNAKNFA